jgi:hypothetical protein
MFYNTHLPDIEARNLVSSLIALTPSESKRLLAKAVAALPEVKLALEQGIVIIARGTTNAFVAEELTGNKMSHKSNYAAGFIVDGELSSTTVDKLMPVVVLRKGKRVDTAPDVALREFGEKDVSIKGANAIDADGNVAVAAAGPESGTIGGILPTVLARHSYLIVPVGLEKMVPSVPEACRAAGILHFKYSTGLPVALVPMPGALAVTEIQAFEVLTDVKAVAVAAGGIAGSEGTTVLSLTGKEEQIENAMSLVRSIKGEPTVGRPSSRVNPAAADFDYDAIEQWKQLGADTGCRLPECFYGESISGS